MKKELKILELFAGVGGFRIGFENSNKKLFKTYWSNQWEPATKSQDAFEVYNLHYPNSLNINEDIAKIPNKEFKKMDADIIVGGFPCQDYSVARTKAKGITGKKGVLFWEIIRATKIIKPQFLILENVDRLLKSPTSQRGRDFAVMLSAFNNLNYSVEWRVINAAEYGMAQRRRRVYFFIYRNNTNYGKKINKKLNTKSKEEDYINFLLKKSLFAKQFPVKEEIVKKRKIIHKLDKDIYKVSKNFKGNFWNAGFMKKGIVYSVETEVIDGIKPTPLKKIIQKEKDIDSKYYITDKEKLKKFKYLRDGKKLERTSKNGHKYMYSEGAMSKYDSLDLPSRTMLTSEGSINRSTHLLYINKKYRILTPIEAERLQGFPDDWTKNKLLSSGEIVPVTDSKRMFFMGNALVTDIVKMIADEIQKII